MAVARAVAAVLAVGTIGAPVAMSAEAAATSDASGDVTTLSDVDVTEDPLRVLPAVSSSSTFGFDKPLLETPRSVSYVSSDVIERIGLSAVEDLARVAPGVFTTTRFGVQGGIDVRNVSADMYFRGMKRVTLQGNGRSVLAALDTIEIVKGPPSPIFGMGRIGGYTNVYPKSGRAKTGTYLLEPQGFAQAITGTFRKNEFSAGYGGPMSVLGKKGGFYIYGLMEDSQSFYRGVPVKQKVLQASGSLDDVLLGMRMEAGLNLQVSDTAGALTPRFSQALVDDHIVVGGSALKNLDLNGNGVIGFLEMHQASPVRGSISSNNQPLIQTWNWQKNPDGSYRKLSEFVPVAGIPQTLLTYLNANPSADPTGLIRAAGALGTGPLPTSGQVPIGMALDPRTVGYRKQDLRRAAAYEREQHAELSTFYLDFINDTNPDFTYKNQLFFDQLDQYKISQQPGCCRVLSHVLEDKITVTRRLTDLPDWLRVNSLASVNVRYVGAYNSGNAGNDYGTHRSDPTSPQWVDADGGMTANTTFATAFDNPNLATDGNPFGRPQKSTDLQTGIGAQLDIDMFSKWNLLVGARWDESQAKNVDKAMGFNNTTGTSASPGAYYTTAAKADDWDQGWSYSASLSYQLPYNLHPYVTYANTSVALDGNNNTYSNNVLNGKVGHIGQSYLKEAGLKTELFNKKLFFSTAFYEQSRTDISNIDPTDPSLGVDATSTRTRGWEMEIKAVPFRGASASLYGLKQKTIYNPNNGGTILVDARTLGFQDVKDAQGNVIFPAEAFLYGGRSRLVLPPGMKEYRVKQGNPPVQMGMNLDYQSPTGYGMNVNGNFFASTYSGRLKLVKLPEVYVFNASVYRNVRAWEVKLSVDNVFDKVWFKARTGDTLGDALAQVMPGRKLNVTAKYKF
jgi:outer membrane receptor protein involved in Fe transport